MVQDLRLYINDKLVDLSTDPQVLYTYQQTDVTNPTAVKNSFSKTITLVGTPNNNDIFGHYWNLERFILNGGEGGAFFNSSKKAPFQLFRGNDLYEEGYAKLNAINKVGDIYKYEISLFGGLGDFFWNLSSSDSGDEKKLSDLSFTSSGETEFDFTANIGSVYDAWNALRNGTPGMWQHINFMPAYNGIPNDFDADKIIINATGTTLTKSAKNSDDNKTYTMKSNFTVGTLPAEMTEWDVRDLRSYLQRPCIKMSSIINACCNPENNGGYTVDLDPDFFNDNNVYWSKTFLSLPMIQDLENSNDQQVLEGVDLVTATTTGESQGLMYQDLRFELGEINPNVSNITLKAKITPSGRYMWFCPYTSYVWFWNWNGDSYHTGNWCLGSLFVQLIAVNGDTVVGASEVYNLTTPIRHNGGLWYGHNGHYPDSTGVDPSTGRKKMGNGSKYIPYMDANIYNVLGKFTDNGFVKETSHTSSGSTYSSTPAEFTFHIYNIGANVTGLKMVYYWGATADKIKKTGASNKLWDRTYDNGWMFRDTIYDYRPIEVEEHNVTITGHNINAVMGESLGRTGTKVTKQLLLNTESSPCDYLLSYCKMFGLYFTKDIGSKTVHIMTRKSFFQRDNVIDLNDLIDRSKDINITPIMFKSKWYQFLQEKDETEYQKKYMTAKGVEYGCKVLDTGYEFSAEKIDLLKDNCIKSGIEGLEKSKWFTAYNNDDCLRPWMNLGLKYTLWNGSDTMEYNAGVGNSGTLLPINEGEGLKYYDIIPKLQFHDDKNSPTDGNNCLVFFSGFKTVNSGRANPLNYILSDDSVWQTDMNEGTPCWLFTKEEMVGNKRLCYKLDRIPVFERYYTGNNSGSIMKSLDFGSAQELYVPNYSLTDDTNIYYNFWGSYLSDLFNVNTKQMTCYIRIKDKPGVDWLRRFYWFDNAIWVANKISDYNIASYNTTKVEFIKVQDVNSYSSISQGRENIIELSASTYHVGKSGGNVTLRVTADAGVSWTLKRSGSAAASISFSPTAGTGSANVTATFGQNTHDYSLGAYFYATRNDNGYTARIYIEQGYTDEQSFRAEPEDIVIPASGGSYEIDFIWYNQGSDYVDLVDFNEGSEYLQFTADTTTKKYENKAIITFGQNTGTTVLHNYCTFKLSRDNSIYSSIGIDQLPASYSFKGIGENKTMTVEYASGATFTDVPYWLKIVDNNDNTYTLTAIENLYDSADTVTVTMTKNTSAPFNVTLRLQDDFVSPEVLEFDYTGSTATLVVRTESTWRVVAQPNWITLTQTGGTGNATITVSADTNPNYESRVGTIVFYDFTRSRTYIVHACQADNTGVLFTVTREDGTGNVLSSGGTVELLVVSNKNPWTVTANSTACTLSMSGASSSHTMTATLAQNDDEPREIVLTFTNSLGNILLYTISQDGTSVDKFVEPSALSFPGSGGTGTFSINTPSDSWQIVGRPSWVSVSSTAGTSSATITVTADTNTGYDRTGSIVVYNQTKGKTYVVTIIQETGNVFMVARVNGSGDIPATGGLCYLEVSSPGKSWTASTTDDFISLDKTSYTASTGLYVTFSANTGTSRVATINFIDAVGQTISYTQSQAGAGGGTAWVTPGYIVFEATGGTATINVNNSNTWQIVAHPNWVDYSPTGGTGSVTVTVDAPPYSGASGRTGTLVFYDTVTLGTALVVLNQNASDTELLAVSPSSLFFDEDGGTATLTIISNRDWTIG